MWSSVTNEYALEQHELLLLEQACRTASLVEQLQETLDADGPVLGAKVHPVVIELRMQRLALARLLVALRVPTSDEDARPQRRGLRGVEQLGGWGAASSA